MSLLEQVPVEVYPLVSDDTLRALACCPRVVKRSHSRSALAAVVLDRDDTVTAFAMIRTINDDRLAGPTMFQVLHALSSKNEASEHWFKYAFPKSSSSQLARDLYALVLRSQDTWGSPVAATEVWRRINMDPGTMSKEDALSLARSVGWWSSTTFSAISTWLQSGLWSASQAAAFQRHIVSILETAPINSLSLASAVDTWCWASRTENLIRASEVRSCDSWTAESWLRFLELCTVENTTSPDAIQHLVQLVDSL